MVTSPYTPTQSQRLKRIKGAKKAIARAERIRQTPLHPIDVDCPICGAQAASTLKRRDMYSNWCRTPQDNPLPHHGHHKAREIHARAVTQAIERAAERARAYLKGETR